MGYFTGLVGLPVSLFLYWLVLRPKKDAPFPKGGLLRLLIAGAVSVAASTLLTLPISAVMALVRTGAITDPAGFFQTIQADPGSFKEALENSTGSDAVELAWHVANMFFGAGLLEEGLKYVTGRIAIKKEGMIRTWMDSVVSFAVVGLTFELLENIVFGAGSDIQTAIIRALVPAHFIFGVIMGYFFGKYLVTKEKKYVWLSLVIPIVYHTVTNVTVSLPATSVPTLICHGVAAVATVVILMRWQKNKTLDVPVAQFAAEKGSAGQASAAQAGVGFAPRSSAAQPGHAQAPAAKAVSEHEYTTYPRRFNSYAWFKPLLVGLIFSVLSLVSMLAVTFLTKLLFGAVSSADAVGYDGMDFYTAAGAFGNGATAAAAVPCLLLAALIVRDRPISSYFSSMGGWRWKVFQKTLAAAFVILGIPIIVSFLMKGKSSDVRFTLGGFVLLTLFVPFQSLGEELTYRSYITQTVSSWFMLPLVGIVVQTVAFAMVHPYNIVGVVEIVAAALLYMLCCLISKGLEAPTALHIINNMMEIWMTGFGFGVISSEMTVASAALSIFFKLLFFLFIVYADKKLHWFEEIKRDDVERWNAKAKA